jgi:hypothetical protein
LIKAREPKGASEWPEFDKRDRITAAPDIRCAARTRDTRARFSVLGSLYLI